MKNLMVCRFCLATNNTLIGINNNIAAKNIVTAFGYSATEDDGLPQFLCSICFYLVAKFALFRRRCDIAQTVFENAALEGRKLTASYIESLDRKSIGLCLPLKREAIKIVDTMKIDNTKKEFIELFDTKPLDIFHEELLLISDDDVDVLVSPHIKEENDTKESIDVIDIKNESVGEANTNIEKSAHENLNECFADVELKVEFDNDNTEDFTDDKDDLPVLSPLSVKEQDERKELNDTVKENKKSSVDKAKTKCRKRPIRLKEPNAKKQKIDRAKVQKRAPYLVQDFAVLTILSKAEQLKDIQERVHSKNYINSQLKCDKCYRGFGDRNAFKNHLLKHDPSSGDHICDICKLRYQTARTLRDHAISTHERKFACKQCNHVSNSFNQAHRHYKEHNNFLYTCKYCDATFRKHTTHVNHVRMKHASDHVCNICGASFIGPQGLKSHKLLSHRGDEKTLSSEPKQNYCEVCDLEFKTTEALEKHTSTSSKHNGDSVCSLCCVYCGEAFETNMKLLSHSRRHEKPVHCEECGQQFANTSKCYAHHRMVHLGIKFVCEVCGKDFASSSLLMCHQRTHTGESPYQCKVCDKAFKTYLGLQGHMPTHTGVKHPCPHCARVFTQKYNLTYHLKKHIEGNETENSEVFPCHLCNKNFTLKSNLKRHLKLHTGTTLYHCEVCSKSYNAKRTLEEHMKHVHMGVPYPKRVRIRQRDNDEGNRRVERLYDL